MEDSLRELFVAGVAAAKAHDINEARRYLERLLRLDPPLDDQIEANYWLSQITIDPVEKRNYIEAMLAINPMDMRGRRELAILDGKLNPAEIVDPDRMTVHQSSAVQNVNADRFTCPRCGGRMTYTPDGSALTCEYCASHQQVGPAGKSASNQVNEDDFVIAMATGKSQTTPVQMRSFDCQGCGSSFILSPEQLTLTCPYCAANYVIDQVESRTMATPDGVIPFKFDHGQAQQILNNSLRINHGDIKIQGIYTPAWSFDISGTIPWNCLRYSNKKWVPEKGEQLVLQNNCLISASKHQHPRLQSVLDSFNFKDLVPYDPGYLAAWLAETFQVAAAEAALDARKMVLDDARKNIEAGLLGTLRDLNLISTNITIDAYKLVLLPVWYYQYTSESKSFDGYINGQTGSIFNSDFGNSLVNWLKKII